MLEAVLLLALLGAGLVMIVYATRSARAKRLTQERLELAGAAAAADDQAILARYQLLTGLFGGLLGELLFRLVVPSETGADQARRVRPFLKRYRLLPWVVGVVLGAALHFLVGLHLTFAAVAALMAGLLGGQVEALLAARKSLLIETQLGEAIDLMVGSLRAGASVLGALESASQESRRPLRPQLEEVLGRIRYGDDPQAVLRGLVARVPLESFRLFATALAVHWEVGGSLAPTLATVGRSIRDRVEVSRRISAQTSQARFSVGAVLVVTYFIGFLMWQNDPERMTEFLGTAIGRGLVAAAALLQALGVVWTAILSRVKY